MRAASNAVNDLIQTLHSRRMQTDPSDELLFASRFTKTNGAARMLRWTVPDLAPALPTLAPTPRKSARHTRTWLWIVATLLTGVLAALAVTYVQPGHDMANAQAVAMPTPTPAPAAASPAPGASPTSAEVATPADPAPTIPTIASSAPTQVAESPLPPTPTPMVAPSPRPQHRLHAAKRAIAKRATAKKPTKPAHAAAPAPAEASVAEPTPARHQAQADDSESPLSR
jgi:hypothetical protein